MRSTARPGPAWPSTSSATYADLAHEAPVVNRWLLAHPRVQLHFTPTYSSWISQVTGGSPSCSDGAWTAACSARSTNSPPRSRTGSRSGMFVAGFFNMIYGIAAIANSHVFVANAHYVIGDLRAWGWVTLIIAVLQLVAAAGILAGNQLARWFAVAVVGLNAIDMMFFIPAYPFWALVIIAVDVVALYGLCVYGSRQNLDAV